MKKGTSKKQKNNNKKHKLKAWTSVRYQMVIKLIREENNRVVPPHWTLLDNLDGPEGTLDYR